MSFRKVGITLFFLLGTLYSYAQLAPTLKDARVLVDQGEYLDALDLYEVLDTVHTSQSLFYKGYCHYQLRHLEEAEFFFLESHKRGYDGQQLFFLMGQLKQAEGKYDDATQFYKQAFKNSAGNKSEQKRIINALNTCANSEKIEFQKSGDVVKNLGEVINTYFDETYPLPSPTNEGLIYFSSNNDPASIIPSDTISYEIRNAEMYKAKIRDNKVLGIDFANDSIRSDQDEFMLDLTENGQVLFYLHGLFDKKVSTDTFVNSDLQITALTPIASLLATDDPRQMDLVQDSIFIFASDQPGGFGGYDLYFSVKRENTWLQGVNLGSEINGPYDELSPYLTKDGRKLYFSSNRDGGLGGFDVYRADYSEIEHNWNSPKNAKFPINSSGDDLDFKVSILNPKTAVLSSNRLLNNMGGFDIYEVILNEAAWKTAAKQAPGFYADYMNAFHTQKVFMVPTKEFELLPLGEESEAYFRADSIRLAEEEMRRIEQEQRTLDSLFNVKHMQEQQRIQDSLMLVQVEEEQIRRQQIVRDSLLQIEIDKERLIEELRLQDSLVTARSEENRIRREENVRDSLLQVELDMERMIAEKRIQDSLAIVRIEEDRIRRQEFVRDSLMRVEIEKERLLVEQRTQDSIALVRAEEVRIRRQEFVRDSLMRVEIENERLLAEQLFQDSVAIVRAEEERLLEIRKEQERLIAEQLAEAKRIQEQRAADSLMVIRLEQERMDREESIRDSLAMEALLDARRKRDKEIQDSLAVVEAQVAETLASIRRDSLRTAIEEEEIRFEEQRAQDSIAYVLQQQKLIEADQRRRDSLAIVEQQANEIELPEEPVLEIPAMEPEETAPVEFLNFHTISLSQKGDDIVAENQESIEVLKNILKSYPNALAEIEGFHPAEGPSKVYDLFNSIKLAEALKNELSSQDIQVDQLSIKGHGSSWAEGEKRVIVRIYNRDLAGHIPNPEFPFANEDQDTPYFTEYLASAGGIHFKVEAIRMTRMLANKAIDTYDDIMLEQSQGERSYAYLFGRYPDLDEAMITRRELIQFNFKNPKIIPYLNGSRITEQQARFIVDQYPVLEAYLRYLDTGN